MLPARSQATSVGRWNDSPSAPAPGSPPPRPPPAPGAPPRPPGRRAAATAGGTAAAVTAATASRGVRGRLARPACRPGRHQRQRRHAHRFRLAAENHLHAPVGIELDHLRRRLIDDPDVVLRIDAHLLRLQQTVGALADLPDELAGLVELQQPGSAVRHRARGAERDRRIAGARVEEDVALRIGRHAGRFPHVNGVGEPQQIGARLERNLGNRRLGDDPAAGGERDRREHRLDGSFHGVLLYRALAVVGAGFGFKMIFWARQAEISDTNSSFGLRQSISCTVLNSPRPLPALPNRPMIRPSSSIL